MEKLQLLLNNSLAVGIIALLVGLGIGSELGDASFNRGGGRCMMEKGHMMNADAMNSSMEGMMMNLDGKKGEAFDKAFLEEMIVHHEGAVEMAESLLKNTVRPELKKMGQDIISAQTGEIQVMKKWQAEWFGN